MFDKKLDDFIGHANDDQPDISSANELRLNQTTDNPPLNVPKEIAAEVRSPESDSETPDLSASEAEDSNIFRSMFIRFNLTKDELYKMSRQSCSERNFCVKLIPHIFLKDELHAKNCNGKRGKQPLNQDKLGLIRETVFKVYSVSYLMRNEIWRKCVISVEEYLRRKK